MIPRKENVLGLDVSMHHALLVRVLERIGDFAQNLRRIGDGKLPHPAEPRAQILARDERHRIVEESALGAGGQQWHNVRMLQSRCQLNLSPEPIGVDPGGEIGRKNFDHDLALEIDLVREKDA